VDHRSGTYWLPADAASAPLTWSALLTIGEITWRTCARWRQKCSATLRCERRSSEGKIRIATESANFPGESVLFILSDGEPTDGDATTILPVVADIRQAGTTVVSCFVTGFDITEPRRLYGKHQNWPGAAELMFECASELPRGTSFDAYLHEHGWHVDPGARLFAQVNHSEMLTEFLNVVLSQLRPMKLSFAPTRLDHPRWTPCSPAQCLKWRGSGACAAEAVSNLRRP